MATSGDLVKMEHLQLAQLQKHLVSTRSIRKWCYNGAALSVDLNFKHWFN